MTSLDQSQFDLEAELRALAESAGSLVRVPDDLAGRTLRVSRRRRRRRRVVTGAVVGLGALASVAAVKVGGGPYFDVTQPSASMAPTIRVGEEVTFNRNLTPAQGDVVHLDVEVDGRPIEIISRVIALDGDTVGCPATPDGACDAVLVNGRPTDDPYLDGLRTDPFAPVTVGAGKVFVLGDDRDVANDSRMIGAVPLGDVDGVAVAIHDHDRVRAVPGAPRHHAPDEENLIDPPLPVPPASAQPPS